MANSRHRREVAVTQSNRMLKRDWLVPVLRDKSGDEHCQKRKRLRPGTVIVVLADCPSTVALVL
jgi:hypothetical protein